MLFQDEFFQLGKLERRGFENNEDFAGGLDFSLPPVVRFDPCDQVGARDQSGFQCSPRQHSGGFRIRNRSQGELQYSRCTIQQLFNIVIQKYDA